MLKEKIISITLFVIIIIAPAIVATEPVNTSNEDNRLNGLSQLSSIFDVLDFSLINEDMYKENFEDVSAFSFLNMIKDVDLERDGTSEFGKLASFQNFGKSIKQYYEDSSALSKIQEKISETLSDGEPDQNDTDLDSFEAYPSKEVIIKFKEDDSAGMLKDGLQLKENVLTNILSSSSFEENLINKIKVEQIFKDQNLPSGLFNGYCKLTLPKDLDVESFVSECNKDNIEYIEPNYQVELFEFPRDPKFYEQWSFHQGFNPLKIGFLQEINKRLEISVNYAGYNKPCNVYGLESIEFDVSFSSDNSLIIDWDTISNIDNSRYGSICMVVTDGSNWIHAEYYKNNDDLQFKDSNDNGWTYLNKNKKDGTWSNQMEIFKNKYNVNMANFNSGWINDSLFSENTNLKIKIFVKTCYIDPKGAFDNVSIKKKTNSGPTQEIFYDDFNDNSLDQTKWREFYEPLPTESTDKDYDIDAPEAWDIETGSSDIVIAVVDSGIDYKHEDLTENIWNNTDEIPNNGIDDDNNGYIDDFRGWNFNGDDNDPMPYRYNQHGTMCAGVIGAIGNNGVGIAGVCWDCSLMPVKCFENDFSYSDILADGIIYAADNGADIISMSWGSYEESQLIKDAIEYAYSKGCVLVSAAGNENTREKSYPAAFENVISVAATDKNDKKASFSNWGSWIDVAAPGLDIYTTERNNQYRCFSGTSAACPHVAGVAGLLLSKDRSLTQENILTIIKSGADEGRKGISEGKIGYGLDFDGKDDYMALPLYYKGSEYGQVTVSAWIKTTNGNDQIIASSDRSEYWRLEINGNGASSGRIGWDVTTDTGCRDMGSSKRIDDGNWHYVVGSYENGKMKIYIDGVLDESRNTGTKFGTGQTRYSFIGVGSEAEIYDGKKRPDNYFDGSIDEICISNVARDASWILVSYNNINNPNSFINLNEEKSYPDANWWDESWIYRKKIDINHNMINENLENFPVLINIVDSDLSSKAQSDADDIVFTDNNGEKLNHEIELFEVDGKLITWVNVTSINSSSDTTIYMYYGNPQSNNQENSLETWDSNFVMVQHLNEAINPVEEYFIDSSKNGNDGHFKQDSGLQNRYIGTGRLNANNSLNKISNIVVDFDSSMDESILSGNVVIKGQANGADFKEYSVYYGKGLDPTDLTVIKSSTNPVENKGTLCEFDGTSLDEGIYTLRLEAHDKSGKYYFDTALIIINNYENEWHVNINGTGDFTNIHDAIYNSGDGDTIVIHSGTYEEGEILVDKKVNIIGLDKENVIIASKNNDKTAFIIIKDNVNIQNLTINGGGYYGYNTAITSKSVDYVHIEDAILKTQIGIQLLDSKYASILNNTFCDQSGIGILSAPSGDEVFNNLDNLIELLGMFGTHYKGYATIKDNDIQSSVSGILLIMTDENIIENNKFDSSSYNVGSASIELIYSSENIISDNEMENGGLFTYDSYDNVVDNNIVSGNPLVYLKGKSGETIRNAGQIFLIDCDDMTISNNDISDVFVGIELIDTNNCNIKSNKIADATNGICMVSSKNNTITNNEFIDDNSAISSLSSGNIIKDNTILGSDLGISIIGIKSFSYNELSDEEYELNIIGDQGKNVIINNDIISVSSGIITVSNGENIIERNTMEGNGRSSGYYGMVLISFETAYLKYKLNGDLESEIIGGKKINQVKDNTLSDFSSGVIVASNSENNLIENTIHDVSIMGISSISINSIDIEATEDQQYCQVNLIAGNQANKIINNTISCKQRYIDPGIAVISDAPNIIKGNKIEDTSEIGLVDIAIKSAYAKIDLDSDHQSYEVSLIASKQPQKIVDNLIENTILGIILVSNSKNEIIDNTFKNIDGDRYTKGLAVFSASVDSIEVDGEYISDSDEISNLEEVTISSKINFGKGENIIERNELRDTDLGIFVLSDSENIIRFNRLHNSEFGIISGSIDVIENEIVKRDYDYNGEKGYNEDSSTNELDIAFGKKTNLIEKNDLKNTITGITVFSNGENNVLVNELNEVDGIGISSFSIDSINMYHKNFNHMDDNYYSGDGVRHEENIHTTSIKGGDKDCLIKGNEISDVGIDYENQSSAITVASEGNTIIENNNIKDLSGEIDLQSNGILLVPSNSIYENVKIDIYVKNGNNTHTNTKNYIITKDKSRDSNIIRNNIIDGKDNGHGINFYFSDNNEIYENIIKNNKKGIMIKEKPDYLTHLNNEYNLSVDFNSNNNHFYHNNFIKNDVNAYDECDNSWDDGSKNGGNYWDDFDEESEGAYDEDGDGIVDSPYEISGGSNKDKYPLINKYNINSPPNKPDKPLGPNEGTFNKDYEYIFTTKDFDGDELFYKIDWGDTVTEWLGPYSSGQKVTQSHSWSSGGKYDIKVKAKDNKNESSEWSDELSVSISGPSPKLSLTIKKGFSFRRVSAILENKGNTVANDINFELNVKYGIFGRKDKHDKTTISVMKPGSTRNIEINGLCSFGRITVNASINSENIIQQNISAKGFIIRGFIFLSRR